MIEVFRLNSKYTPSSATATPMLPAPSRGAVSRANVLTWISPLDSSLDPKLTLLASLARA